MLVGNTKIFLTKKIKEIPSPRDFNQLVKMISYFIDFYSSNGHLDILIGLPYPIRGKKSQFWNTLGYDIEFKKRH